MIAALVLAIGMSLPQDSAPPASLESLLESVRARRETVLAHWEPIVAGLLKRFDDRNADGIPVDLPGLRADLVRAAERAAPLLVPWIEPGESPQESAVFRAREITQALYETSARGITRELVQLCASGTPPARRNAVRLLARTKDPEVVGPTLRRVFRESKGKLAQVAARSMILAGGPENLEAIREAFRESEAESLEAVVTAIAQAARPEFAPEMASLILDTQRAAAVVERILEYFAALPELFSEETALAFIQLIASPYPSDEAKIRVLEKLPDLGLDGRDARDALDGVVEAAVVAEKNDLADAARICLAILGDRQARKRALLFYDRQIERDRTWPGGYEERADVLLRMREYNEAIRDYRKAIDLSREDGKPTRELRVRLARAYARSGKLRTASETLRSAALTQRRLDELAEDEDFAPLAEHSRYGKIFAAD